MKRIKKDGHPRITRVLAALTGALVIGLFAAAPVFGDDAGRFSLSAYMQTVPLLDFATGSDATTNNSPAWRMHNYDTTGAIQLWYGKGLFSSWTILSFQQSDYWQWWGGQGWNFLFNVSYDNDHSGMAGGKVQIGHKAHGQSTWDASATDGQGAESNDNIFQADQAVLYGWFQIIGKRVFINIQPDIGVDANEYAMDNVANYGGAREYMIYGASEFSSPWSTPGNLLFDGGTNYADAQRSIVNVNFKSFVRGLQFGFGLPQPGYSYSSDFTWHYNQRCRPGEDMRYWNLGDFLMDTNFGFKYSKGQMQVAGGFKLDPTYYGGTYIGMRYSLPNGHWIFDLDGRWLNNGGTFVNAGDEVSEYAGAKQMGELRFAARASFNYGKLSGNVGAKVTGILRDAWFSTMPDAIGWGFDHDYRYDAVYADTVTNNGTAGNNTGFNIYGHGSRIQVSPSFSVKYPIYTQMIAKLEVSGDLGFGTLFTGKTDNSGLGLWEVSISPSWYWAWIGNVNDNLGSYTGMYARYTLSVGNRGWEPASHQKIMMNYLIVGFRWAFG